MPEFHETGGRRFYERDVPEIAKHLGRIADALEQLAYAAGAPITPNTTAAPAGGVPSQ